MSIPSDDLPALLVRYRTLCAAGSEADHDETAVVAQLVVSWLIANLPRHLLVVAAYGAYGRTMHRSLPPDAPEPGEEG